MVMKVGFGVQQHLDMTPILKLTIAIGQFRSAFKLRKSIGVLRPKNGDAKNELGDRVTSLRTCDFGVVADLNRQIDKRNHDANRANDLSKIGEVVEVHSQRSEITSQRLELYQPIQRCNALMI